MDGLPGEPGPQGPKSAILPWRDPQTNEVRYLGWICIEAPEPWFEDIIEVTLKNPGETYRFEIDEKFMYFCQPGSIRVTGVTPDKPAVLGATINGNQVTLRAFDDYPVPLVVTVRICGIRGDQADIGRFPEFTEKQAKRNLRFWNDATREE